MVFGYARASVKSPDVQAQADRLYAAGAEPVYVENGDGAALDWILGNARPGDAVMATGLDVLAPDRRRFHAIRRQALDTGVDLVLLDQGATLPGPYGDALETFLRALWRMERNPEVPMPERAPKAVRPAPVPDAPPDYWPEHVPEPDSDWVPDAAPRVLGPVLKPEPGPWPAWIGPDEAVPRAVQAPVPGPRPDWIPEPSRREAAASRDVSGKRPAWIPSAAPAPVRAGPEPAPWPDWVRRGAPAGAGRQPPRRHRELCLADWVPDPPEDRPPAAPCRALPFEPSGTPVQWPLPGEAVGRLPDDALLKPDAVPLGPDGLPAVFVRTRPKATGRDLAARDVPVREDQPGPAFAKTSAAERIILKEMRERRRLSSFRHMVIAAIVTLLILLGILAAALPRLSAARVFGALPRTPFPTETHGGVLPDAPAAYPAPEPQYPPAPDSGLISGTK